METIGFLHAAIAHEHEQTDPQEPLPVSQFRGVGIRRIGLLGMAIAFSLLSVVPFAQAAVQHGEISPAVSRVQEALKSAGLFWVRTDGVFGSETHTAVKIFQAFQGLPADGVVGPQTAARLNLCGVEYGVPCAETGVPFAPVTPQPPQGDRPINSTPSDGWGQVLAPPETPVATPNPGTLVVATRAGRLTGLTGPGLNYPIAEIYTNGMRLAITGRRMNGWLELTNGLWVDGGGVVSPYDVIPPAPGNSGGGAGDPSIPAWPPTPNQQMPNQPAQVPQMPNQQMPNQQMPNQPAQVPQMPNQQMPNQPAQVPQMPNQPDPTAPYSNFNPIPLTAPQPSPNWIGTGNTVVVVTPGNDLNARMGPGIEYAIANIYTNGTRLSTTGYAERGWVQLTNGLWVAGNYVRSVP